MLINECCKCKYLTPPLECIITDKRDVICKACYREIHKGKITNCNISFFGGRKDVNAEHPYNDIWNGQANAIRAMEDLDC